MPRKTRTNSTINCLSIYSRAPCASLLFKKNSSLEQRLEVYRGAGSYALTVVHSKISLTIVLDSAMLSNVHSTLE